LPTTFSTYQYYLQSFCDRHGHRPAMTIKPFHVNQWLDSHPSWKASRRRAMIAIKRAFS
jgi:hypothetical protein